MLGVRIKAYQFEGLLAIVNHDYDEYAVVHVEDRAADAIAGVRENYWPDAKIRNIVGITDDVTTFQLYGPEEDVCFDVRIETFDLDSTTV